MIKQVLHKGIVLVLTFLVLLSTMSFIVESHFCGSTLIDTAIFTKAKGCSMDTDIENLIKKNCCKDTIEIVKGQDELQQQSFDDFSFGQQLFLKAFVYSYFEAFQSTEKQVVPHKGYMPPLLVFDIQLLDDVFLI